MDVFINRQLNYQVHHQLHICLIRVDGGVKDPNFSRVIFALRNGNKARLSRRGHVYFNSNVRNLIIYFWLSVSQRIYVRLKYIFFSISVYSLVKTCVCVPGKP